MEPFMLQENFMSLQMTFAVEKLVDILKKNRAEHEKMATEAKENYIKQLKEELAKKLDLLMQGKAVNPHSSLAVPQDNLKQYNIAISMLEMTNDSFIVLDEHQYNQYVNDEWTWTERFLETASMYSDTARNRKRR
jgi:hypothetical protein